MSEYESEKKKGSSISPVPAAPTSTESGKTKKGAKESDSPVDELNVSVKKDMVIIGDTGSSQMSSSSGDTEGKDTGDDWEKDFELDDEARNENEVSAAGLK